MIDVHAHILPQIDDGSRSVEESIKMIKEAYFAGFTDIITTSHYMEDYYDLDKDDRKTIIDALQDIGVNNIKLHNGAESYITPNLVDLYKEGIIPTLANSKYPLVELPINSEVIYWKSVIDDLIKNNYIPIIAHVERYKFVQNNIKKAYELVDCGALLQCNYGSFIGNYGYEAQKIAIKLLKRGSITVLGTDAHRCESIYTKVGDIINRIEKTVGSEMVEDMTINNPMKIIKDKYI